MDAVKALCINVSDVMSPMAQRFALSDVTQQQQNMSDQVSMPLVSFDRTTLLTDETEAFALEPIDITSVGQFVFLQNNRERRRNNLN